jgi:hypothetical protein
MRLHFNNRTFVHKEVSFPNTKIWPRLTPGPAVVNRENVESSSRWTAASVAWYEVTKAASPTHGTFIVEKLVWTRRFDLVAAKTLRDRFE